VTIRPAVFDSDFPAFDKTSVNKALAERAYKVCGISRRCNPQKAHYRSLRLLRARRERPKERRRRRAAEQRDELAAFYPDHVKPRACAVKVRLSRALASLAYFVRCQTAKARSRPLAEIAGRAMKRHRPRTVEKICKRWQRRYRKLGIGKSTQGGSFVTSLPSAAQSRRSRGRTALRANRTLST
jgi:hypothetical protein